MGSRRSTVNRRRFLGYSALAGAAGFAGIPALAPRAAGAAQAEASGEVRLAYYDTGEHWHSVFQEAITPFQEANPQIELETERRAGEQYWDKLQVEFAAGQAPDISIINMDQVVPAAARGMFVDLKPFYERDGIDLSAFWYPVEDEWGWQGAIYGGLLYAGGQMLYINKGLLAETGLEFPAADWTWDDMVGYAKQLTVPDQNQWGLHLGTINPPYWGTSFIHGAGGTVLNEARNACTLTSPESRAGLQFLADLIHTEQVMPTPSALEGQENPFLTGKIAIYFGGSWEEVNIRDAGLDWDFAHMPVNAETGIRNVQMGSNAWSILSSSENQEAAWEVIKYLIGEEAQRGLMGLGLPVLKSVVDSEEFLEIHAPQDISVPVADFTEGGHHYYPTPDANEWWNVVDQELSVIWSGEASVEEATDRACQAIDEIFARRPPEWSA